MKPFYLLSILLICCLGTLVYSNTFHVPFQFDDDVYVVGNASIRDIHHLGAIWSFCPTRFLTFLSLALNWRLHGLDVIGYHLFNLIIHLCCAVLVWWLTLLTLSSERLKQGNIAKYADFIALSAGLVFVSHPIQTEAVTYIWQRASCLAAMFYLASLCCYVQSRMVKEKNGSKVLYLCSLSLGLAAMFSKETAITLPLMVLFYESNFLTKAQDIPWRRLLPFLLLLPVIPLTVLLAYPERFREIQYVIHGYKGVFGPMTPLNYFLTECRVMVTYIRLAFLPVNQNLDYDYPVAQSIFELPVLASLVLLLIIFLSAREWCLKYRAVSFFILWFFICLLPESSILPQHDVIFEHRLYLALAGYSIFLACGAYYVLGRYGLKAMAAGLGLIIAVNSLLTFQRNKVWQNEFTLWSDVIRKSPHKSRGYVYRGLVYDKEGKFDQAIDEYDKALAMDDRYVMAYNNRGNVHAQKGDFASALADYETVIRINPDFREAYHNLETLYADSGDFEKAISFLNKYIELDPRDPTGYVDRGIAYFKTGDYTKALGDFTKIIGLDSRYPLVYYYRAYAYYQLAEYDSAWRDVRQAQAMGYAVDPAFINALKKSLGRP